MFKVQKTEYINKTFRMPVDLVKTLEKTAQNNSVSLNNLIIQCCNYALNDMENDATMETNKKLP